MKIFKNTRFMMGGIITITLGAFILVMPRIAYAEIAMVQVNAERSAADIQAVPLAVSTFSASDLETRQISDLSDLQRFVPGLSVAASAGTARATQIYFRGTGETDSRAMVDPSVGIYLDGIYLGRQAGALLDLLDIENIEVLRGPQGTLYGRNTVGGAIKLTTTRPDPTSTSNEVSFTLGNANQRDFGFTSNIAASTQTAIRLSAVSKNREGFFIQPASPTGARVGGRDLSALRLAVSNDFTPDWNFTFTYDRSDDKSQPTPQIAAGSAIPFILATNDNTDYSSLVEHEGLGFIVKGIIDDRHTFTWTSGIRTLKEDINTRFGNAVAGTAYKIFTDQEQLMEELIIASDYSGIFNWAAGVYYYDETVDFIENAPVVSIGRQETTAYAGYAQFKIIPIDKFSITAGIRYTNEERDLTISTPDTITPSKRDDTPLTYRLNFDYEITDSLLFYASYATAFKSGGWAPDCNINATPAQCYAGFNNEEIETVEVGLRTKTEKARLNFTYYLNTHEDLQINGTHPDFGPTRINVPEAQSMGFEFEFDGKFTDHFGFFGNASLVEAKYENIGGLDNARIIAGSNSGCALAVAPAGETPEAQATREGEFAGCVGNLDRQHIPEYKAGFGLSYARQINDLDFEISGFASVEDGSYLTTSNNPLVKRDRVTVIDLRAKISDVVNLWDIEIWGKNISDIDYAPVASDRNGGQFLYYADPTTSGITFTAHF